jgi:hypothetical protein
MSRPAIVTTIPPIGLGGRQPLFAEEAGSEPTCECGLSTGAGVLNAGSPSYSTRPTRLRRSIIPRSMATLERCGRCRDTIAAISFRTRDRPLTWTSRARAHRGANQPLAWE